MFHTMVEGKVGNGRGRGGRRVKELAADKHAVALGPRQCASTGPGHVLSTCTDPSPQITQARAWARVVDRLDGLVIETKHECPTRAHQKSGPCTRGFSSLVPF